MFFSPFLSEVIFLFFNWVAGGTLCSVSFGYSSIYIASFCEQDFLGFLCVSGGCFCPTSVASHAEHKGSIQWTGRQLIMGGYFFLVFFLFGASKINAFLNNLVLFCYFQIVEPFTAHYVFALGVARFLSCAHWVLQVWSCKLNLCGWWISLWLVSCDWGLNTSFEIGPSSHFDLLTLWKQQSSNGI